MEIAKPFTLHANAMNKLNLNNFHWRYAMLSCFFYTFLQNFFSFILEKTLLGYVYDATNANTAKNKTTKYFNFNIQSEEENYKCVCFSPEKHRLLKEISNESIQKRGVEIKRFKLQDDSSDLMATDYRAVKKENLILSLEHYNCNCRYYYYYE